MNDCESANHAWKEGVERSPGYRLLVSGEDECYWEQFGEEYYRNRTRGPHFSDVMRRLLAVIPAGIDLIEIGPGPGVFTLPLARHCCRVTAIEPSVANVSLLKRKTAHLGNVKVVEAAWQDVELEEHDVVFGAGVLYAFYNLENALSKMIRSARRKVVLVTVKDEQPLLSEVTGALGLPGPQALPDLTELAIEVLRGITTCFSFQRISGEQPYRYHNVNLLLDLWKHSLDLPRDMLPRIKSYLKDKGYRNDADDSICVSRKFSSYIIEIAT